MIKYRYEYKFIKYRRNPQVSPKAFNSFIQWVATAQQLDLKWSINIIDSEPGITQSRNQLINIFLENPIATHLMFIAPNIAWEPHHVLQLLSSEKHIVGGCIDGKNYHASNQIVEDEIEEVTHIDPSFMMISKEAFIYLNNHKDNVQYTPELPHLKTYFDTSIIDGKFFNEDDLFMKKWKDMGGKLWSRSDIQITDK